MKSGASGEDMQPNLNPWGDYLRFRRELYTKDSETKIVNALNKFLKLK